MIVSRIMRIDGTQNSGIEHSWPDEKFPSITKRLQRLGDGTDVSYTLRPTSGGLARVARTTTLYIPSAKGDCVIQWKREGDSWLS